MHEYTCRTCLATHGELVSIFSNDRYVHNLWHKLYETTRIKVMTDDGLPQVMCKKCIFLIDAFYTFKDQCEMSQIKLSKTSKEYRDVVTSSEEDYHIEYASEEARLEVESARKRSRLAKRHNHQKNGLKVKSVEIIPKTSNKIKYESVKHEADPGEYEQNTAYRYEDDERMFADEYNNSKAMSEKLNHDSNSDINHQLNLPELRKSGYKRYRENGSPYNVLTKVPKRVIFEDQQDENLQYIEHNSKRDSETSLRENVVSDTVMNVIENSAGNVENIDIPLNKEDERLPKENEDYSNYFRTNNEPSNIMDLRIQNLMQQVVLNVPNICPICSQYFESYVDVLKHKIVSHGDADENFQLCPVCHEHFYTNSSLAEHLNEHMDIQSFVCSLCSNNFYTESKLRAHLETHVDLHQLNCLICSKSFMRVHSLLNHLEHHLDKISMICTLCSSTFDNKTHLQIHLDTEHTRSQLYRCPICGEDFPLETKAEHDKVHQQIICNYCGVVFDSLKTERLHIQNCKKRFELKDTQVRFVQDQAKETPPAKKPGEKKFRCRVCREILISRAAYTVHLKKKHLNSTQASDILRELAEGNVSDLNKSIPTPTYVIT